MNQNVKVPIKLAKKDQTMNFGALMMMEDMEPRMAAFSDKSLPTLEGSKTQNASTATIMKLSSQEFTALAQRLIMNAI